MSRATSLHQLLRTDSWDLETIRNFLECDHSSINEQSFSERTPLLEMLRNSKCSIDIVKILLQYGADFNHEDEFKYTPLLTALRYCRDEAIVAYLLEKGASIHVHDFMGRTPLRSTFGNCYREDYLKSGKSEWKENVLNLLLGAGADLNKVDVDGQSPLCYALWEGADVHDIKLLLRKGGSLKACMKHASPLLCATDGFSGALLRANVVELLLSKQASVEAVSKMGFIPLQCALYYCRFETAAMRMLIDNSDVDTVNTWNPAIGNLLHIALLNLNCKSSIINLLLHRGFRLAELNIRGQTPLHLALGYDIRDRVIEILLKRGAPVNIKCKSGTTPLRLAVESGNGSRATNLLLAFGASIGASMDQSGISLLETALDRYGRLRNKNNLDAFKTLAKYYLLENPGFDFQSMIHGRCDLEELSVFPEECAQELRRMESVNISPGCTLRKFISGYFRKNVETDNEPEAIRDDFNQVLRTLAFNEFPVYFDIIASKIGKDLLGVYAVEHCPVRSCMELVFNYECVCELSRFLSDGDVLRFIVACYNADNHA